MAPTSNTEAADAKFRAYGLEPVGPYVRSNESRECACVRCGTTRFVRLSNLKPDRSPCRWCAGWDKWLPWASTMRERSRAATPPDMLSWWNSEWLGDPAKWANRLLEAGLLPVTPVVDRYEPVGVVCARCGDSMVVVPSKVFPGRPDVHGCTQCAAELKRLVKVDAPHLYAENGLELLAPGGGLAGQRPARCVTCGTIRTVSYLSLLNGTAPLCWTCTYGIRPDEPHRVYLFHFPELRVFKVGLTHNRHDRRVGQHEVQGGVLVSTVVVGDRSAARQLEGAIKSRYQAWTSPSIATGDFPQGGWTETWSEAAPPLDLEAEARALHLLADAAESGQ